jgi:hypothetical protein
VALGLALVIPAACGETGGEDVSLGKEDAPQEHAFQPDLAGPDQVLYPEQISQEVPWDTASFDGFPDGGPVEGEFGWPCNAPEDCNSGFCILTGEKKICTVACVSECPKGYVCAPVSNTPPDVTYICLPRFDKLCQPCMEHKDCQPIWGAGTDLCLDYGNEGKFCGAECSDGQCPAGYQCGTETAPDGSQVQQCRYPAEAGLCQCSALSKYLLLSTSCALENAYGKCPGNRECLAAGLSLCDAPAPVAETCNNEDDECNGTTDDIEPAACLIKSDFGECEGEKTCVLGTEVCQGPTPSKERGIGK